MNFTKDSTSKLTRGEQALEEILFPNTNKINSYRSMPKRKTTFRISVKLWKVWFLALDYINSDGWYSAVFFQASNTEQPGIQSNL